MKLPKVPFTATWFNHTDSCAQHGRTCSHKGHDPKCDNYAEKMVVVDKADQETFDEFWLRFGKPVVTHP